MRLERDRREHDIETHTVVVAMFPTEYRYD
jgi:hypothetical protein